MNIHEAVLQPITAFVYCNRHAAAAAIAGRQTSEIRTVDRRRPLGSEIILLQHGTTSKIILKNFSVLVK